MTQTVTIALPEEIYRRLEGAATATQRSLQDVIVQSIRGNLPPTLSDLSSEQRADVTELQQMDDDALWSVAKEPLPGLRWRRHKRLLEKAAASDLTEAERKSLGDLRQLTDRLVLRRSFALALLKWRGHSILSPS